MWRIVVSMLVLPLIAVAQSDDLRAQIRADLMEDPRTAEMSSAEFEALVDALAGEAEAQGTATPYLESKNAPTFTYDPAPVEEASQIEIILSSPIVIAIFALVAGLLGLILFMLIHRRKRMPESPVA
jgi:hypothetical protein